MAITVIENITLITPVGQGVYRKDFQSLLWVHMDQAPWRDQISFDVFGQGGLVILTPGDANGHTAVSIINPTSGLTNVPTDKPGEQLIRGIYKETSTDPGVEFWISVLVGGIDYNPSSMFPEQRDDFGPMKKPATTADLSSIDYYQHLISSSTKSKADLSILKSLKESLTPKMILAKDINWLRNSILAVQKAYFDLVERLKKIEGALDQLAADLGILDRAFQDLHDYVHNNLVGWIRDNENEIVNIKNNLLPNGLLAARNDTYTRVYKNMQNYGVGGSGQQNWTFKDDDPMLDLYKENHYSPESVSNSLLLDEFFKTLIVHNGDINGSNKVVIENNRIAMFHSNATASDVNAGIKYEAMLGLVPGGGTVLDLARTSGTGTINIGENHKLWIHGNEKGGWISTGENAEASGAGIAMTKGLKVGAEVSELSLMATHLRWTNTSGAGGLINWGYSHASGHNYVYQTFGQGGSGGRAGFAIIKSETQGLIMAYTGENGKSCGFRMSVLGLEMWGLSQAGIVKTKVGGDSKTITGEGMETTPPGIQAILNDPAIHEAMYNGSRQSARHHINN